MTNMTTALVDKPAFSNTLLQTFVPSPAPTPPTRPGNSQRHNQINRTVSLKLVATNHSNTFSFSTITISLPAFYSSPLTYSPSPNPSSVAHNCPVTVVLFHDTDLRLHDNPALHHAKGVVASLVLRPRSRSKFWECCVRDLHLRLSRLGCELHIRDERPQAISDFCREVNATHLHYNRHSRERASSVESDIDNGKGKGTEKIKVTSFWTSFLHNPDELPFGMHPLPKDVDEYGRATRSIKVPLPLPAPKSINSVHGKFLGHELHHLNTGVSCVSGESLALCKVNDYIDGKSVVGGKDECDGENDRIIDTKFGRMDRLLSLGCLSPRFMWHSVMDRLSQYNVRRYCTEFELVLRDFTAIEALISTGVDAAAKKSNKCLKTA